MIHIYQLLEQLNMHHIMLSINYEIIIIDVDNDEISNFKNVKSCDKIIIPGGFGQIGIESMIKVSKYCRENNIPCLGMQVMFIDICRNLLNYNHVNSNEFNSETNSPVIDIIPECDIKNKGGSLSLGLQEFNLNKTSKNI